MTLVDTLAELALRSPAGRSHAAKIESQHREVGHGGQTRSGFANEMRVHEALCRWQRVQPHQSRDRGNGYRERQFADEGKPVDGTQFDVLARSGKDGGATNNDALSVWLGGHGCLRTISHCGWERLAADSGDFPTMSVPVAAARDIGLVTRHTCRPPRHDMRLASHDGHGTSGADIVLDSSSPRHGLDPPRHTSTGLRAVTTLEDARELLVVAIMIDRRASTAGRARAVAPGSQYQPLIWLAFQAPHGLA